MSATVRQLRLGAAALAVAGVLFVAYPASRPWRDESTVEGARAAMGDGWWVASHLFAMLGFILVPVGLLAVRGAVGGTRGAPLALAATVWFWIGAGLVLPYYGAEDFGLHAIARADGTFDLLATVDAVRYNPVAVTLFGVGLLLLAVAAVLVAVAVRRSGVLPMAGAVVFAVGFALYLPQFFAPPAVRIGHGVLTAIGCGWLAVTLWRAGATVQARP